MYAITNNGWRAISSKEDVTVGETLSLVIPETLLRVVRRDQKRVERDELLRRSDWTQGNDSPLDAFGLQAWEEYRQRLRDFTKQPGFPDIPFPQPPNLADGVADAGVFK